MKPHALAITLILIPFYANAEPAIDCKFASRMVVDIRTGIDEGERTEKQVVASIKSGGKTGKMSSYDHVLLAGLAETFKKRNVTYEDWFKASMNVCSGLGPLDDMYGLESQQLARSAKSIYSVRGWDKIPPQNK